LKISNEKKIILEKNDNNENSQKENTKTEEILSNNIANNKLDKNQQNDVENNKNNFTQKSENLNLEILANFNFQQKTSDLLNSEIYKNYLFNKEELEKIKVDITFEDNNNCHTTDQTQLAVEFTKKHLKQNPEMGYLIRIIKRLLQIQNLNNSFNGKNKNNIN
jgi:hypothetical protein